MTYPVRNFRPRSVPWYQKTTPAKIIASVIQTTLQTAASRYLMAWALRLKSPRSRLSMKRMKSEKPIHSPAELPIEFIRSSKIAS